MSFIPGRVWRVGFVIVRVHEERIFCGTKLITRIMTKHEKSRKTCLICSILAVSLTLFNSLKWEVSLLVIITQFFDLSLWIKGSYHHPFGSNFQLFW